MTRTPRTDRLQALGAGAAALAALALSPGCDNPACVFGGSCQDQGTSGALGDAATLPFDGAWIDDGAPVLESFRPTGNNIHSGTPVVLRFSESMASATLNQAVQITQIDSIGTIPVVTTQALIGDGRVLVLLPTQPLQAGKAYQIRYALLPTGGGGGPFGGGGTTGESKITDLTGQELIKPDDLLIGTFTVGQTDPVEPSVLMTWPPDGALSMSDTTEIAVIFDREMDPDSFTAQSWVVEVDGEQPDFDPAPAPLSLVGGLFGFTDARVWRYHSLDAQGEPAPLGLSAAVELSLSPTGAELVDVDGEPLPATIVAYETASFGPPTGAALDSEPADAIGIANLTVGDPEALSITATLSGAQSGDRVTLFLFGLELGDDPDLVALKRDVTLSGAGPFAQVTFTQADIDLVDTPSPLQAELADGELAIALRLARGSTVSPVRVLDVDLALDGKQGPVLDTLAPTLVALTPPGGTVAEYRSDVRDLAVVGRASEPIRAARVVTALGDNGAGAPAVLGATDDGHFLAAPVPVGILDAADLPLDFDLTIYDAALNPAPVASAQYAQRGAVTGAAPSGGSQIAVEVYDARTLAPVAGALVFAHADDGAGTALVDVQTSDASGQATLLSASGFPTILTVDARDIGASLIDYDLFTFHGVSASRVAAPLTRAAGAAGTSSGAVAVQSDLGTLTIPLLDRGLGDTRRSTFGPPSFAGGSCGPGATLTSDLECAYGPATIEPGRPGAVSFLAGNFELTGGTFSPLAALQAFELHLPRPPVASAADDDAAFAVPNLLSEPGADLAELPAEFLAQGVVVPVSLIADVGFTDPPLVSIESRVPGLRGAALVGLGIAFAPTPLLVYTQWTLRAAYAGTAGPTGPLALLGTLDGDPRIRGELRDGPGNVAMHRRRRSLLAEAKPIPNFLVPPPVSDLVAPAVSSGAAPYDVVVENTLADFYVVQGLYRVTLADAAGRRWVAYVLDPPDAAGATARLRLPDLAASGGAGLANGTIQVGVELAGWDDFDPTAFQWSDLEREFTVYARAATASYQQP